MTNKNEVTERRYFILVGSQENWKTSMTHNLWGFTETSKGSWNKTNSEDLLAFYAMLPLRRIIGFGRVGKKFVNNELIWNDEKLFKRSLWKYKFEIKPSYVCEDWKDGIELPHMMLATSRKVIDTETFSNLVKKADSSWDTSLFKEFFGKKYSKIQLRE